MDQVGECWKFPKYVICEIIRDIHMVNFFHRCGPFVNQFYNYCINFDTIIHIIDNNLLWQLLYDGQRVI